METTFKRFMTAFAVPAVPALVAFVAVVSTEPTENLAPARLGTALLTMAIIWVGGSYLLGRYVGRKR